MLVIFTQNGKEVKSVDRHVWTSVTLNSGEVNAATLQTTTSNTVKFKHNDQKLILYIKINSFLKSEYDTK